MREQANVREQLEEIEIVRPSTIPKTGSFGDRITYKIHIG